MHGYEEGRGEERSPAAVAGVEGGVRRGGGIVKLFGGKMVVFFRENVGISCPLVETDISEMEIGHFVFPAAKCLVHGGDRTEPGSIEPRVEASWLEG